MAIPAHPSRRELETRLIDRAWRDAAFRRALIEEPRGTLERELEVKLPAEVRVTVLEETPTSRYLVLPPRPRSGDVELSGDELEAVAGGYQPGPTWQCTRDVHPLGYCIG
jgi:hypothetical protein